MSLKSNQTFWKTVCESLTHAVLHHHEPALVSGEAIAPEITGYVHTRAVTAQIRRDAALVDICEHTHTHTAQTLHETHTDLQHF